MKPRHYAGLLLIIAGLVIMVFGSVVFTMKTYAANLNSIELSDGDRQSVYRFLWTGFAAGVIGGVILLTGIKKK